MGIRDGYGTTWPNNIYNDDIIWGALMAIRSFAIFNDGAMKDMAINNFNLVWNRGWDTALGGGIWWTTDKTSKNACVNAPAAICAMLIYYATGDTSYRTKARMIMNWMKSRLYDANTGEVKGAINAAGVITEGSRTYTQGCFIGAASELQKYFASENWIALAVKATDYAKNVMSNAQGLLPDEYCGSDDCPGFKSIFARWVCKFVKDQNRVSSYGAWLDYNAKEAWRYRNSKGLMWAQWWRRTPDGFLTSWETASGVSMMNCVFLYRTGNTVSREATEELSADNERINVFSVFPTRTSSLLTIETSPSFQRGPFQITAADGTPVRTIKDHHNPIDISNLANGLYFISIQQGGGKVVKKFIKE
ncbi:glycoside hydrolase family 76 protein [Pseudochryseolinea flava]|uniref:glycoside hydrolase family 76 protein n=1 Tax=Pseudochryseolinea flava TaxID=2059302 RepID=UPI001C880DAC|nr:glycoside hydrolase family 76 protein [Pseudochryseolinea flava]